MMLGELGEADVITHSQILPRDFYSRSTILVAIDLVGKILLHRTIRGSLSGKILEVEAYLGESDPACHASRGRTKRTNVFWQGHGRAYVFLNYGIHHCLNAITCDNESPGCVLIRAVEPLENVNLMEENRGTHDSRIIANGPGKLTQAFGITLEHNGADLTKGDLVILKQEDREEILVTSRIGISKAEKEPLRFRTCSNIATYSSSRRITVFFKGTREKVKKAFNEGILSTDVGPRTHRTSFTIIPQGSERV